MEIAGRTVLVTGGGSGLGAATARMVVEQGGSAVVADVDTERGGRVAAELGERARFVPTDVTDEASVGAAVAAALELGGPHVAVSCAGIAPAERVLGRDGPHSLARFVAAIQVNLVGTFNVTRLAAQAMAANEPGEDGERGVIVNTASVAAFDGQIGQAAYSASKAGVAGMTLPIARELARHGIRVLAIAPGIFDTPMLAAMSDQVRASLGAQVPFPSRLGHPTEYAALVRHIVENRMLNGETIRLDGAIRMAPR
ncbi:MAG TPA: SDR family NAD(P)-dependent oxidoreductase [Actinomycetes bacterium]|nr:SDR family NAD(P)-dependent oxidoreductase [Actinomycetes bacterium]